MKAQAAYGQVLVTELTSSLHDTGALLARKEAVALIKALAIAVLQSGDTSDPDTVLFAQRVMLAADDWLK
jgi:hypothetical protein